MTKKYKNSVIIEGDIALKKRNDSVIELFDYLETRNFNNFPKIVECDERNMKTEFIKQEKYHEMTSGVELIKTMSMLHYKTLFFKEVSKNKYKNIYDKLISNIEYLKSYYEDIISEIESEEYMSPSHYLFARNYSAIDSSFKYVTSEIKRWFKLVENKSKERVCVVHNNINSEHFIKGDKNYLISWDKHVVDTPVLDIYKFYKKEGYKLDFNYLLSIYSETLELLPEEKMLLNILISMPPKIEKINNEYLNTVHIKNTYNYIYSGMNIVNINK